MTKPRIAITMGDAAGIGPEVVVKIDGPDEYIDQSPAGTFVIGIAPFEGIQKGFNLRGGEGDIPSHFHDELRLQSERTLQENAGRSSTPNKHEQKSYSKENIICLWHNLIFCAIDADGDKIV